MNANTGGSVHHTRLPWPLPAFVIAVSFAAASERLGRFGKPALGAVLAVMLVSGGLLINEHYALIVRNGGTQPWPDAILNLSTVMKNVPAKSIFCMDWGILDQLRMLQRGALPL